VEVPDKAPPTEFQYGKLYCVIGEEVETEPPPAEVDVTYLFPPAS
jgi:hypothetical protein